MKKLFKVITGVFLSVMISFVFVACGSNDCKVKETVTLAKTILGEVEFENSENVTLKQDCEKVIVSGSIDAMSAAESSEFGKDDVTHVVVLKFMFDKEKTIDSFEIKGGVTKVYSTDEKDENYVGSISELLDNEADEDAYTYLVLSANTKEYTLTSGYTDGTKSIINLSIEATLASAKAE